MDKLRNKGRCPCCSKTFKQLKRHISKNLIRQQYIHSKCGKTTTSKLTKINEKVPNEELGTNHNSSFMEDNINSSSLFFDNSCESYTKGKESHFTCFPKDTDSTIYKELVLEKQQYIKNRQHHLPTSTIARIKLLKIL